MPNTPIEPVLLRSDDGESCLLTATRYRHSLVMRALLGYARMAGVEQQLLTMTTDEGDSCLEYAVEASNAPGCLPDKTARPCSRRCWTAPARARW